MPATQESYAVRTFDGNAVVTDKRFYGSTEYGKIWTYVDRLTDDPSVTEIVATRLAGEVTEAILHIRRDSGGLWADV